MFKKLVFIFTLALISLSCDSYTDPYNQEAPNIILTEEPIVTGIWMSTITGNSLGPWGNPSSDESGTPRHMASSSKSATITADSVIEVEEYGFALNVPTPNPSLSSIILQVNLPDDQHVRIFIARARLAGTQDLNSVGGAVIAESKNIVVYNFPNRGYQAGRYSFEWDGTDNEGRRLPAGFYRIYAVTQQRTLFHDIYLANSREEFLPGMPGKN